MSAHSKLLLHWFSRSILLPLIATASIAAQAAYPERPITLIVPFPAGGGSDNVARMVAAKLETELGQPVVVENKAGAGGNIGTRLMTQAKPDGYSIGLATPGPVSVGKSLYKQLPYDPEKELRPVILLNESPLVLASSAKLPVKDMPSLQAWAKQQKEGANAGIGGTGSINHLMTELYRQESGASLMDVPYKGGAEAVTDTIAGHVDMLFIPISAVLSSIKANQLTPLFITSNSRSALLPDVPAAQEVGLGEVVGSAWNGIVVPAGTPDGVVAKLNEALNAVLKRDDVREAFRSQGLETKGGTPDQFREFIKADADKWRGVIEKSGMQKI